MELTNPEKNLKGELRIKWESLSENTSPHDRKYFHLKTLQNLIFHFDEIRNENDKRWVYSSLENYINECHNYIPSIDRTTSSQLYLQFIDKVTDYYRSYLGFILILDRNLLIIFYVVLFLLCYFIFNIWVSLIPIVFFILQFYRVYKKRKDKRVFSLFY
jgi:hypothetical protein